MIVWHLLRHDEVAEASGFIQQCSADMDAFEFI